MNNPAPQPPELTEDEFYEKFKPRDSPEGSLLWERQEVLKLIDEKEITDNEVWTVVDTDDGTGAIAGWAMVNAFAYMVTQNPWTDVRECMMFDSHDEGA